MKLKTPHIVKFVFLSVGFILGCYAIEALEHYCDIAFEPKLTLGDLTNAGTVLIAALLVTYYLERHNKSEENEKSILLGQLESLQRLVQDFEKSNECGNLVEIASFLKRIRRCCDTFQKSLTQLKYSKQILREANFETLITSLRKLATDTPIAELEMKIKKSNCDATVKDNIITLTTERRLQLDGKISDFNLQIFTLQILINKF